MQLRHIVVSLKAVFILLGIAAAAGLSILLLSGGKMLSVQSGSMAPAIPKGSLVVVNRVPVRDIAAGDVITFTSHDKLSTITHRVVTILDDDPTGNNFVTKGDANDDADTPIEAVRIVGRVEKSVPYLGYGIDFLKQPLGLLLLIYLPALLIIIHEYRRLTDYYRRIQPYSIRRKRTTETPVTALLMSAALFLCVSVYGTTRAFAVLQNEAVLTGNRITSVSAPDPDPDPEPEPPVHNVTCTNDTDVTVQSTTDQTATSGDAIVSGNTTGGSATSGNASNSSSTSVNIEVDNEGCVPAT